MTDLSTTRANESSASNERKDADNAINSGDVSDSDDSCLKSSDSSGSFWSVDDSIEFLQTSHKPLFDELPTFSIKSVSPSGRLSPISNEPISLFNLSISPISSIEDLTRINDQSIIASNFTSDIACGKFAKDLTPASDINVSSYSYEENDRISLDEITAQINTPPSILCQSRGSHKRLNLETIFEGVFLHTPPKKRKSNFWRMGKFHEISSYVFEQQQHRNNQQMLNIDSTKSLCNVFDDKINLNS